MNTAFRILLFSVMLMVFFMCGTVSAASFYELAPDTIFQEGCVAPCMCPVMLSEEVKGTFLLTRQKSDNQWYSLYRLSRLHWTVTAPDGGILHTINGRGIYQVGGDFALTQQLTLEVRIDGGELQYLDSGMIPGGEEFPVIAISVDRGTECYDIWLNIRAVPVKTD
jgi:hypothetical protein